MHIQEFSHLLDQLSGSTFVSLDTVTIPTLKGGKKNPQQGRIVKVGRGHKVMIFTNKNKNAYEAKVNRERVKEGNTEEFKVAPLKWGEHRKDSPLIDHNGKVYLQVMFIKSGEVSYEMDGEPIDKDDIIGLPVVKDSGRQELSKENMVVIRAYDVQNIRAMRAFGEEVGAPVPAA